MIKKIIPIKSKIMLRDLYYNYKTKLFKYKDNKYISILSIQKSGTNYLRLLLANYISLINDGEKVDFGELERFYPNMRDWSILGNKEYQQQDKTKNLFGYDDLWYGHTFYGMNRLEGKKILLYRNPLDMIVSYYNYKFINRPNKKDKYNSISDSIEDIMKYAFIPHYLKIKTSNDKDIIKIQYEDLVTMPDDTLKKILEFLEIPVFDELVIKAIEYSSKKSVRDYENKVGKAINAPSDFVGSFVRSGKIGQWKDSFNQDDIDTVNKLLLRYGVSLNEFITEEKVHSV